ncbi:MAG: hypothetical protein V1870_04350 [Candidatus Aenigmatarchaeota archaeon]
MLTEKFADELKNTLRGKPDDSTVKYLDLALMIAYATEDARRRLDGVKGRYDEIDTPVSVSLSYEDLRTYLGDIHLKSGLYLSPVILHDYLITLERHGAISGADAIRGSEFRGISMDPDLAATIVRHPDDFQSSEINPVFFEMFRYFAKIGKMPTPQKLEALLTLTREYRKTCLDANPN